MLTDTGRLIALLDENDRHHASCVAVVRSLPNQPLITTWLCFTEAIYFWGEEGGYHFQERLWKLRRDGILVLLELTSAEGDQMDAFMAVYQNVPMDAADASLLAVAQSRSFRSLFTLDSDFYIYRLADSSVLEIVRLWTMALKKILSFADQPRIAPHITRESHVSHSKAKARHRDPSYEQCAHTHLPGL